MNQKMNVGKRFKGLLVTYGISQNELADEFHFSSSTISDKLNGNSIITVDELTKFLLFINSKIPSKEQKDPNYILGWETLKEKEE